MCYWEKQAEKGRAQRPRVAAGCGGAAAGPGPLISKPLNSLLQHRFLFQCLGVEERQLQKYGPKTIREHLMQTKQICKNTLGQYSFCDSFEDFETKDIYT